MARTPVYIVVTVKREDLDWSPEDRDNLAYNIERLNKSDGSGRVHAAVAELAKAVEATFVGGPREDGKGTVDVEVVSHYFDIDG